MADRRVAPPKGSTGGKLRQPVQCIVIHSLEAPARKGMALSLATGWLQNEKVSIHAITDPGESIDMVSLDTVAFHCGGGNQRGVGDEVTGYAAWTREQWLEPTAFAALRLDAKKVAEQAKALGIPLRWLKVAQIKAGERGLITHNDARLAFGGTTHTDPGPGFPYDIFLKMCQQWAGETVDPATNPNPQPTGQQTGGAQPEEDDMNSVRLVKLGGSATIWMVDFAAHTKWAIRSIDELNWLKAVHGDALKSIGDDQAPWVLDGYRVV